MPCSGGVTGAAAAPPGRGVPPSRPAAPSTRRPQARPKARPKARSLSPPAERAGAGRGPPGKAPPGRPSPSKLPRSRDPCKQGASKFGEPSTKTNATPLQDPLKPAVAGRCAGCRGVLPGCRRCSPPPPNRPVRPGAPQRSPQICPQADPPLPLSPAPARLGVHSWRHGRRRAVQGWWGFPQPNSNLWPEMLQGSAGAAGRSGPGPRVN